MTNPVSNSGGLDRVNGPASQKPAKADRRDKTDSADSGQKTESAGRDEVHLSDVAMQARTEPTFDRAKVDAIKQALKEGQYPLDSRRIAENFVAIERMIKG